jgi:hypothetical protein
MDLTPADVALLNQIRKRHRLGKLSLALFALMALAFTAAAFRFGLRVAELKVLPGAQPLQLHGTLTACGLSASAAIQHAGMGLSAWRQSASDALLLKPADQRSGFPDHTR